jgi:DNA-binding transcriptional MocR family regulator
MRAREGRDGRARAGVSLTHEVTAALRGQISTGQLRTGQRLPSERVLAAQLKVSRVTVVRALARLRIEGLVVTRHGSGTYVATTDRLLDTVAAQPTRPAASLAAAGDALDVRWATTSGPAELIQIAAGAVRDALPAALRSDGESGETLDQLAELLADYLSRSGLATRASQLTLTSGAMTGLGLVLDVSGPPGRIAITDTPTYPAALHVLARRNYRIRGWPAGPADWEPARLSSMLRRSAPGVLYLQPDGHNPTGATMPPVTRDTIVPAAARAGWLTVADETMRPLRLVAESPPSLAAYDGQVIVISSLSKTLWGGLHLGWIRAATGTTRRLRRAVLASGAGPSALDQIVAARLLPSLDTIVARRAKLLASNFEHLRQRLRDLTPAEVSWHTPSGGITVWLDLQARSSHRVVQDCARLGVLLEPASTYTVGGRDDRHLRVPFTLPPVALDRVADVLRQVLDPAG